MKRKLQVKRTASFRASPPCSDAMSHVYAVALVLKANRTARRVEVPGLSFYIASPGLLYAEKLACTLQKNRLQDPLHKEVLARFLKMELCHNLEQASELEPKDWLNDAKEVKTADFQFFSGDPVLARRMHAAATRLPPEFRSIVHWIRHQVPI